MYIFFCLKYYLYVYKKNKNIPIYKLKIFANNLSPIYPFGKYPHWSFNNNDRSNSLLQFNLQPELRSLSLFRLTALARTFRASDSSIFGVKTSILEMWLFFWSSILCICLENDNYPLTMLMCILVQFWVI